MNANAISRGGILLVLGLCAPVEGAVFTVTKTNVTGAGSLQQALWDANTNAGPDLIHFNIPGDGPHIISPTVAQPLPSVTNTVTIDGYTQTNATPNTLGNGFNGVIKIQLDGISAGSSAHGITLATSNCVLRGLSVTRFGTTSSDGIRVNGNNWVNSSDRNLKENFRPVDAQQVLEKVAGLAIQEWNYKSAPGQSHVGPVAQDFHAAFGLGMDDKHIATVDADGVALAAIQGLNQKVEDQRSQLAERETEIVELKRQNAQLARRLEALEQRLR